MNVDLTIERWLLLLLFFITVTQFGTWGYQSVHYILSVIFNVTTTSTPFDVIVGFIAMIGSGLVFAGSVLWWSQKTSAFPFITNGAVIFAIKNIFDIFNEIIRFAKINNTVTSSMISDLATNIGGQFFQLAFWIFIFFFFRYKITALIRSRQTTLSAQ